MKSAQEWLREDFTKRKEELVQLERALGRYSDLHRYRDRWEHVYYATEQVNARVTDCLIKHNCGCCSDSPLEVYPFLEEAGMRIFSDPTRFVVGHKCPDGGEHATYGWEKQFREAKIPEVVIEKVAKMFEDNPPQDPWDDDDDDD